MCRYYPTLPYSCAGTTLPYPTILPVLPYLTLPMFRYYPTLPFPLPERGLAPPSPSPPSRKLRRDLRAPPSRPIRSPPLLPHPPTQSSPPLHTHHHRPTRRLRHADNANCRTRISARRRALACADHLHARFGSRGARAQVGVPATGTTILMHYCTTVLLCYYTTILI